MAIKTFTGRAASVAQVSKIAYLTITAGQTYSVSINGKAISYVATTGVLGDLIDALVSLWNSSAEPEHQEMIAARREDPTLSGLQLTGRVAGVPCTVTGSATVGLVTGTTVTAASGPMFWNVAANWSGGTLPAASDDLIVEEYSGDILYGLTDTNNYASLKILASFTGSIGLPSAASSGYPEYRTQRLTLGSGSAITIEVGSGVGTGSGRIRLELNNSNTTLTVFKTGQGGFSGEKSLDLIELGAGSTVRVYGGSVKIDQSAMAVVDVYSQSTAFGASSEASVDLGSSTVTTLAVVGGSVTVGGNVTTLIARTRSSVIVDRAAAVGTVRVSEQAVLDWRSSAGITTTLDIEQNGDVRFGTVATTKTVAACKLFPGGRLSDPMAKVTWSTGVVLQGCRISDVEIDLGLGYTI
jgi:hypothetical protein